MGNLKQFSFYVYECPLCKSQHHTKSDALACCCTVNEGYSCPACEILHKTIAAADLCCSKITEVTGALGFSHKKYPVIAMRWKGDVKSLNYILGQGASQYVPSGGVLLGEETITKGDWIVRKHGGKIEIMSNEQFHEEYETEE